MWQEVRASRYKPAKLRLIRIPRKRRDRYRTLRVRFYPICERCVAKIRVTSGVEVLGGEKKTLVV